MNFHRKTAWLSAASGSLLALALAHAAPVTTSVRGFPGVTATLDVGDGKCPATVPLTIQAPSEEAFRQARMLSYAMGWAQLTAETACPTVTAIDVTGIVGGIPVYKGLSTRANGWVVGVAPTPQAAPAVVAQQPPQAVAPTIASVEPPRPPARPVSAVSQCDALAAHPEDPEAFATGISDDTLNPEAVIAACEAALKQDTLSPRLSFQLARGYLKAERLENAVEQLLVAAKKGHGAALAYLADIHLDGAPGIEPDPAVAYALYQRAVASGFLPAKAVLDKFDDFTEQSAIADREEKEQLAQEKSGTAVTSAGKKYINPLIVETVLSGDLDSVPFGEIYVKMYLAIMAENISEMCNAHFSKRDVSQLKTDAALKSFDLSPQAGLNIFMGQFLQLGDMVKNPGAYMQNQQRAAQDQELLPEEAMKDAFALMSRHPCNSKGLSQFSKHLTAFIQNEGAPIMSANEMFRNCQNNSGYGRADQASNFCMCFLGKAAVSPITRLDRKGLGTNFKEASGILIDKNPSYGQCRR